MADMTQIKEQIAKLDKAMSLTGMEMMNAHPEGIVQTIKGLLEAGATGMSKEEISMVMKAVNKHAPRLGMENSTVWKLGQDYYALDGSKMTKEEIQILCGETETKKIESGNFALDLKNRIGDASITDMEEYSKNVKGKVNGSRLRMVALVAGLTAAAVLSGGLAAPAVAGALATGFGVGAFGFGAAGLVQERHIRNMPEFVTAQYNLQQKTRRKSLEALEKSLASAKNEKDRAKIRDKIQQEINGSLKQDQLYQQKTNRLFEKAMKKHWYEGHTNSGRLRLQTKQTMLLENYEVMRQMGNARTANTLYKAIEMSQKYGIKLDNVELYKQMLGTNVATTESNQYDNAELRGKVVEQTLMSNMPKYMSAGLSWEQISTQAFKDCGLNIADSGVRPEQLTKMMVQVYETLPDGDLKADLLEKIITSDSVILSDPTGKREKNISAPIKDVLEKMDEKTYDPVLVKFFKEHKGEILGVAKPEKVDETLKPEKEVKEPTKDEIDAIYSGFSDKAKADLRILATMEENWSKGLTADGKTAKKAQNASWINQEVQKRLTKMGYDMTQYNLFKTAVATEEKARAEFEDYKTKDAAYKADVERFNKESAEYDAKVNGSALEAQIDAANPNKAEMTAEQVAQIINEHKAMEEGRNF